MKPFAPRHLKEWFFSENVSTHERARIPLILPFLLAFTAGLLGKQEKWFIAPFFASGITLCLSFFFLNRSTKNFSCKKASAIVALFTLGLFYPGKEPAKPGNIVHYIEEGKTVSLQGRLFTPPRVLEDRTFYFLDVESISTKTDTRNVSGKVRIAVYKPHKLLQSGEIIRFEKIRLKFPRNFKNPGRFDYRSFLKAKNIDLIGNVSQPETIVRLGHFDLPLYYSFPQHLRRQLLNSLSELFPGNEGKLLQAMVFGIKDPLPLNLKEAYLKTGLAHLMAVSGLHIGFVAGAFYFLLLPMLFYLLYRFKPDSARAGHSRKWAALFCLIPVLLYMVVVGAKVSSLRSGIMISAFLIAILINRKNSLFNAFLLAAFFILLWKPESLIDPGFQLSFLAVAGILWVINLLYELGKNPLSKLGEPPWHQNVPGKEPDSVDSSQSLRSKMKRFFLSSALISVTVTLATLPVLLFHFNRISLLGLFLNLFLVPLAAILIPGVLMVTCMGMVSQSLAFLPAMPLFYLTKLFLIIPEFAASIPYSSLYLATPPPVWVLLYYAVLVSGGYALLKTIQKKEIPFVFKSGWITATTLVLAMLIWPRVFHLQQNKLVINVLDIGQGESIFMEFPNGKTLLMDGGGFYKNSLDVGKVVIAPFLWKKGIDHIDYVVATHSDNDHIRGLDSVLELFPVKTFLTFGENIAGYRLKRLYKKAKEKQAELVSFNTNEPYEIGEATLTKLHPSPTGEPVIEGNRRVGNDLSLVARLKYKNFSMLFTGDIGEKVEEKLVKTYPELQVNVLKGPHHGSRFSNSDSFIRATKPEAVVFSSGYLNRMKHPHLETLNRYKKAGTRIYRTDLNGAVQIISNGQTYSVRTHDTL